MTFHRKDFEYVEIYLSVFLTVCKERCSIKRLEDNVCCVRVHLTSICTVIYDRNCRSWRTPHPCNPSLWSHFNSPHVPVTKLKRKYAYHIPEIEILQFEFCTLAAACIYIYIHITFTSQLTSVEGLYLCINGAIPMFNRGITFKINFVYLAVRFVSSPPSSSLLYTKQQLLFV